MAFGVGWLKKIGSVVRVADQVTSNPMVGAIVSSLPLVNSAAGYIHLAGKLFPQPDSDSQRRTTAIEALRAEHPTYDAETLGKLVDAMVLLDKLGVKAVH